MRIELCKGKTKCQECGESMRKGDIRGVFGKGYFSDPEIYNCLNCLKEKDFNINQLVSIYKKKVKEYTSKIKNLEKLKGEI